jgi:hypothetical protein
MVFAVLLSIVGATVRLPLPYALGRGFSGPE